MAGMNFQYDESGGTFYYFLVSFYGIVLIPFTLWVFRRGEKNDKIAKEACHCEPCQRKSRKLQASRPREKAINAILFILTIVGWAFLAWSVYHVSKIKTDHVEYDPYLVLGVDRGASDKQIKKAYRELSRTEHPDKGGEEDTWIKITKAHAALTDAESKKNWEEYGNPDGPGAMQFGIALPKWLVEGNTSIGVLVAYVGIFMVLLPSIVGAWWYKSIKYTGDSILNATQQLYLHFIHKTPNMIFKRALMVLSASFEFWKEHNPEIVERESDDEDVRSLMRMLNSNQLNEKNKEKPLCYPYSIKTRSLLLAHMQRLPLPGQFLQSDLDYILKRSPNLINEMIHTCSELSRYASQGHVRKLRLNTVECIMKLSPLLVQSLYEHDSPLLMLPHINQSHLKSFVNKKRNVKNLRQFCQLSDEERRALLRHCSDEQFKNIRAVLSCLPALTMKCEMKVMDDEDSSITAGAIVTVMVTLTRDNMLEKFGTMTDWLPDSEEPHVGDDIEQVGGPEGEEEEATEGSEVTEEKKKPTHKPWEKNKKKSGASKKKKKGKNMKHKITAASTTAVGEDGDKSDSLVKQVNGDVVKHSDDENDSETEENDTETREDHSQKQRTGADNRDDSDSEQPDNEVTETVSDDESDWENFEDENKKNKLETTSLISHPVHCPYFSDEKQEYWWLYLADKKRYELITAPVRVTNLVSEVTIDVKFAAPHKVGSYSYTMCLKSDSYIDMDVSQTLKFDVKEAKKIENHPQWDISDDEGKKSDDELSDSQASDSEFEYDDD